MLVAGQRQYAGVGCQERESGPAAAWSENQQLNDDKGSIEHVPVRPCRPGWALEHDDGDGVQFRSASGELPVEGQKFSALGGSCKVKSVG